MVCKLVNSYEDKHKMDKLQLEKYIEQGLTKKQIAEIEKVTGVKVAYWITRYHLFKKRIFGGICENCKKPLEGQQTKYCSEKCRNAVNNVVHQIYEKQHERGLTRKLDLIALRGSCCEICGYSKNIAALQFHHLNPEEKDSQMDMRKLSNSKWDWCLAELAKCQVVCGNCHAELHHPHLELKLLKDKR